MQNDMCKNSGFCSRIQKSYKKFGIESKNLIIFSESIPNLYPLCFLGLTQITQISRAFFVGGKSHGCSMVCGFLWAHTDLTDPTLSLWVGNLMDALWFVVFCGLTRISQIPPFLLWVGNLMDALRFVVFCGLTQIQ